MKYALIIGNNKYNDPKLAQLKTPKADSRALARVFKAKRIGNFDEVTLLIDQTESKSRRAINNFLTDKKPDDIILIYFSGHGVLDGRGSLFLALKDTQINSLNATAISSSFISYEMDNCRSRRQILILDCCNSGAFARGTKGTQKAITASTFEGSGSGRVVLTATDSTQFAFEGNSIIAQTDFSLFTHFLLEGLKTGEADRDNDGKVSLDEWYDYCYARITATTPQQIPHKWSYHQQGDLIIAENPFAKKKLGTQLQPKNIQLRAMLDQQQRDFQRHKLLLDSKKLAIIASGIENTKLELQEADKQLLLLSSVVYGGEQKWLAVCGENGLELLRDAYYDGSYPQDVRLGAVHVLGKQGDIQTYDRLLKMLGQNVQPELREIWLDLLAQYLKGSIRQHSLPISLMKDVSLRLIKIDLQESAETRAKISLKSASIGLFCSFLATFLSLVDQTQKVDVGFAVVSTILFSLIGAVLAIIFAQVLTLVTHITRRWLLAWQLLIMAVVGSMVGAGLIFFITAHLQVWFMGGIIGITQAILSRIRNKILSIISITLALIIVFVCSAVGLAEIPIKLLPLESLGYSFSVSLFSCVYFYSVFQVKLHSQD